MLHCRLTFFKFISKYFSQCNTTLPEVNSQKFCNKIQYNFKNQSSSKTYFSQIISVNIIINILQIRGTEKFPDRVKIEQTIDQLNFQFYSFVIRYDNYEMQIEL